MKLHKADDCGSSKKMLDVETAATTTARNPRQLLVDLFVLIAESRNTREEVNCSEPPVYDNDEQLLLSELSLSRLKAEIRDDSGCCSQLGKSNHQARQQLAELADKLHRRQFPICLQVMALPNVCSSQKSCISQAPVLERWTVQVVPKKGQKSLRQKDHETPPVDGAGLTRAVRSHLHFSHLGSFFAKNRGRLPIATFCSFDTPGETVCPEKTSTSKAGGGLLNMLTEKQMFKPCLLDKNLLLNITVETVPRSFLLDAVLCRCSSGDDHTALQSSKTTTAADTELEKLSDDFKAICYSSRIQQLPFSTAAAAGRAPCQQQQQHDHHHADDQPSSSKRDAILNMARGDDKTSYDSKLFERQRLAADKKQSDFSPANRRRAGPPLSITNELFDVNYWSELRKSEDNNMLNKTSDLGATADQKDKRDNSGASKSPPFNDVRFFFPDDDDDEDDDYDRATGYSPSGSVTPTLTLSPSTVVRAHPPLFDYDTNNNSCNDDGYNYWPSWARPSAYSSPDDVSLSDWSPRTPSPRPFDDDWSTESSAAAAEDAGLTTVKKCRRTLFGGGGGDDRSKFSAAQPKRDQSDDGYDAARSNDRNDSCSVAKKTVEKQAAASATSKKVDSEISPKTILMTNLKHKTDDSPATLTTAEKSRHSFVPSVFSRKSNKSLDKSNVVLRFNKRTGLPLSSSPAPMSRNRSSFDFDSSLTAVSAIKRSLQGYDHESGGSSDSDNGAGVPLCKSAPACTNLLGNFEESALNGRIKPFGTVDGFTLELGASGSFWPSHITLPVTTLFFNISDDNAPSPYFGHCSLESVGKKGYYTPKKGIVQATLFNPQGTVVKMFIVRYDLSDMPPYCQTFVRQRTFFMPSSSTLDDALRKRSWLRYLIHLRFATSKSGKLYLHTDIRMLFSRKSEMDAYNDFASDRGSKKAGAGGHFVENLATLETYELRSFTEMPKNPKFSPRKCANNNFGTNSAGGTPSADKGRKGVGKVK